MSSSGLPPMRHDLYFMIPREDERAVLLLPAPGGWTLPHATGDVVDSWKPGVVSAYLERDLGIGVTVLRAAQVHVDREVAREATFVYALENHTPEWRPPAGARWAEAAELAAIALGPAAARDALVTLLLEEATGAIPAPRAPWARRGWLARARAWMETELAALGRPLTSTPVQVKTWSLSCVLRGETAEGAVYFKATPALPLFTHEPLITAALGGAYPDRVPRPLAVEARERWMLLADFGGPSLAEADAPAWDRAVTCFAEMQLSCVPQMDVLLAAGCLDRRLPRLAAGVDSLVAAAEAEPRLPAADRVALAGSAARLRDLCADLAGYDIPDTLVHGDLHANNIAVPGGAPIFFDWSDACVGPPFLDLATLLDPSWIPAHAAPAAALRERYLAGWTAYAPLPRLRAAADLARVLGDLHQAISYQHMVASLEPAARWELAGGLVFWVQQLLADLAARPA